MNRKSKLKKILDEASKGATHIVSNPDTIKRLQAEGLPIEEKFTTYEEVALDIFPLISEEEL